jgi:hypothetical protein
MAFHRLSLLAAFLPMSLVACGSPDTIVPEGTHYHYVVDKTLVPTNNNQAREYGLDLNGDGTVDNQLGMVLGTLAGMGFDIQGTLDKSVNEGSIILLFDLQTKSFTSTAAAGISLQLGDNPVPPACNGSADTTCRHHLDGHGMFSIAPDSPQDIALAGKIIGGTFTGGPGNITLQIALGGTTAITLDLIGARAKASGLSETNIGSATSGGAVLAGALTQDDLNNKVIPAIQTQLVPIIQRDCCGLATSPGGATCNPTGTPPCGCTDSSTGKTILGLFDTMPKDCTVTTTEISNNTLIQSLLAPDVTIDGKMALSLGVKATAVGATF